MQTAMAGGLPLDADVGSCVASECQTWNLVCVTTSRKHQTQLAFCCRIFYLSPVDLFLKLITFGCRIGAIGKDWLLLLGKILNKALI